jgi:aryl-alcohol dehydrogenase-like predicted oxidoreductase
MEKRTLGKTGMSVTVLGFGGAEIGFEKAEQETVDSLLNSALDAGLNVIDTAAIYPQSEAKIGAAVGARRGDFFLFTKCGNSMSSDEQYWNAGAIAASIDRSLKDLRTDHVDLVQLHSCSREILQKGEAIKALNRAREAGKTRFIGYSGENEAALYAVESGAFDTLQISVNIADQRSIETTLPKAKAAGMGVIAKRPIANAAWKTGAKPVNAYHHVYWERLQELKYDFLGGDSGRDLEQSISIALRFTLAQEGVATAIVGTKNPERWKSNAKLLEAGPLDAAMIAKIRARWKEVAKSDWVGQI